MTAPLILTLVALAVSLSISLVVTPIAQRLTSALGIVDYPDNHRKLHRQPIPRCGGIAILFTLFTSFSLVFLVYPQKAIHLVKDWPEAISLGIGSAAIVLLGLLDDRFGLRGRQKLIGQVLICLSIITFGFAIDHVQLFGWSINLGLLAWPVTLVWLLLCINSTNLIDGADGLCASVGWIAFAAVAAISVHTHNHIEGIIAASMAGALLGFLFYNLPPAKVFLGDSGSMLIGLILGVMTMRSWFSEDSPLSITIPIVLMAIPLFDSMMAILRRKLTGRSVFTTDRGHLHHNLMRAGIRNRTLVGVVTLLCSITAGGAVAGVVLKSDLISLSTMVFALGTLVLTRLFGFAELQLLWKRMLNFIASVISVKKGEVVASHQHVVQLQGTRDWDVVWDTLVEFAEKHGLARVSMDLNMPWLHEGFHANWHRDRMPEYSERWQIRLPLFYRERVLGRLEFVGRHDESDTLEIMNRLTELLETMRSDLHSMVEEFIAIKGGVVDEQESADSQAPSTMPLAPPPSGVSA
ncbi:MAG: MraY family glycosyltransferase [Planctomycetota bacterium]|jgi:UDP-GlcNAc:undecaprenyl-phosphate GlcNAc-1-phosphate transferase